MLRGTLGLHHALLMIPIMSVFILFASLVLAAFPECLNRGDINNDMQVTAADARLAMQRFLGTSMLRACDTTAVTPANVLCVLEAFLNNSTTCLEPLVELTLSVPIAGEIASPGDVDTYVFEITEDSLIAATTTGPSDVLGTLFNGLGTEIAADDDFGIDLNFRFEALLTAGLYFLEVRGTDEFTVGPYLLDVRPEDHGETLDTATLVTIPGETEGELGVGDDVDLFRIVLPTASDLTVMTTGNTDTFGSLLDIEGNVLEVDGFQLFDDNTGPGFNFRLQARLPAGTYFVEVLGSDEFEAGRYFLRITSP